MSQIALQQQDISPIFDTLQQIHDGKTHIGEYLSLIFKNLPIAIAWKDKYSIHQGGNDMQARIVGLSHPDEIIGKSDFEIKMRDEEAEIFRNDDQKVILEGQPRWNDIRSVHYKKGLSAVISVTKFPVYDNNKEINSLVCFAYETTLENKKDLACVSDFQRDDMYQSFQSEENYYILANTQTFRLTRRQAACLTYISMGKTIKQISNILDCSSRTIEDHINLLKRKLGVYSTAELIDCFWRNPIRWF